MSEALELAVAAFRAPPLGVRLHAQPLPDDVLDVIRIAAGDRVATEQSVTSSGLDAAELHEAATHYLQLALFCERADSYRTLGLRQDASGTRLKEHYRWLMHWLHPDRDRAAEMSVFSERVNRAWNDLRTPSRREAYDQFLNHRTALVVAEPVPWGEGEVFERNARSERMFAHWLSGRTVRRLPAIVVGSAAVLVAVFAIALLNLRTPNDNEAELIDTGVSAAPNAPEGEAAPALAAPAPVVAPPAPTPSEPAAAPTAAGTAAPARETTKPVPIPPPTVAFAQSAAAAEATTTAPPREAPHAAPPVAMPKPLDSAHADVTASVAPHAPFAAALKAAPPPPTERPTVHAPKPDLAARIPPVPTPAQAQHTLERMQSAYRQGDLGAMMELFAADLSDPPRSEVTTQYAELFRKSRERSLVLRNVGWIVSDDTAVGLGEYETVVIAHESARPRVASGTIRVELRMQDGEARIVRLRHDRLSGS